MHFTGRLDVDLRLPRQSIAWLIQDWTQRNQVGAGKESGVIVVKPIALVIPFLSPTGDTA